jgi:DNA-binding NtrC family response regulator
MKEAPEYPSHPVLIVDDEVQATRGTSIALKTAWITNTIECQDSRDVPKLLAEREPEVILLDLSMPHVSGEELLEMVIREHSDVPVIVVTGNDELETAVRCIKAGAFDYMVKPIAKARLVSTVKRAIELRELRRENQQLKQHVLSRELEHPEAFSSFDSVNLRMRDLFRYVESIAMSSETVLITGETGVGKEIMARCIHQISRPPGPFVPVNVAGLDENAFSDTLFGHRKGAFTGANEMRSGLVEKAGDGTLFLDEIGDLDPAMQVKLLRLLQEREYLPLGSDTAKRCAARIIVATNRSLEELRDQGRFRAYLFYRLRHHHIDMPPLRERLDDLPYLARRVLDRACAQQQKKKPDIPGELLPLLVSYDFPGNVRELEAMFHDAVSQHTSGRLSLDVFRKWIGRRSIQKRGERRGLAGHPEEALTSSPGFPEKLPTLKEAQEQLVEEAMRRAKGNQVAAAGMLGVTRQALNQRLSRRKSRP